MSSSSFGYSCKRNLLICFNIFYIILAIILISVSGYAKSISLFSNKTIIGILVCGVFLLILAFIGICGTLKHHQVLLFFYMVILFLLFLIQFIIGVACLVLSYQINPDILKTAWDRFNNETKGEIEKEFKCCGFRNITEAIDPKNCSENPRPCYDVLEVSSIKALRLTGAIGLTSSIFQLIGVLMTAKYRSQRNPKWNPNEFL